MRYLVGLLSRGAISAGNEALQRKHRGFLAGRPGSTRRRETRLLLDIGKLSQLQEVVPPHYSEQFVSHVVWQAVKCLKQTSFLHCHFTDGVLPFCLKVCFDSVLGTNKLQLDRDEASRKLLSILTDLVTIDYESVNQAIPSITETEEELWTQFRLSQRRKPVSHSQRNLRKSAVRDTNNPRVMNHKGRRSRSPR
jgi:hypothetical protein